MQNVSLVVILDIYKIRFTANIIFLRIICSFCAYRRTALWIYSFIRYTQNKKKILN